MSHQKNSTTAGSPEKPSPPPIEAFEAAAKRQIVAMLTNDISNKKPSPEAVEITAKLMARKAQRKWIHEQGLKN
jgi:hypothetical protein